MKNNNDQKDIAKLLCDRMDELSDTVDVFDKITDRAYPQSMTDPSESGYIVTGLENVTQKSRRHRALKWISAAVAAAVLAFVIPETDILPKILSGISPDGKDRYESALSRMEEAISWGDFISFDVPLSYYIRNDVLITPLMPCPFEESSKDDAMVRLFIRTADGTATNEVYAVEYTDSFEKSKYIAVACSDARFTPKDIKEIEMSDRIIPEAYCQKVKDDIENRFYDDGYGILALDGKEAVSLASYSLMQYVKTEDDETKLAVTDVVYYHSMARFNKEHYYDTYTYTTTVNGNEEITNLPEKEYSWKRSVYFSGISAFPEKFSSDFTETDIFGTKTEADIEYKGWAAIKPMKNSADLQTVYDAPLSLEYHLFANHGTFSTVLPPAEYCRNEFALYVSPYRDRRHYSTTPTIIRITCGSEEICSVPEVFTRSSETEDDRIFLSDSYKEYYDEMVAMSIDDNMEFLLNTQRAIEEIQIQINEMKLAPEDTKEYRTRLASLESSLEWYKESVSLISQRIDDAMQYQNQQPTGFVNQQRGT